MSKKFNIEKIPVNFAYFFKDYGLTTNDIKEDYKKFSVESPGSSSNDFIWQLFQGLIVEVSKTSKDLSEMYRKQERVYYEMASFVREYEGSNGNLYKQLGFACQLHSLSSEVTGFIMEVEVMSGSCCEYCNQFHSRRFSIEEVLNNKYLASEKCTNEFNCNCCYAVLPKKDTNGNLIRIEDAEHEESSIEIKNEFSFIHWLIVVVLVVFAVAMIIAGSK